MSPVDMNRLLFVWSGRVSRDGVRLSLSSQSIKRSIDRANRTNTLARSNMHGPATPARRIKTGSLLAAGGLFKRVWCAVRSLSSWARRGHEKTLSRSIWSWTWTAACPRDLRSADWATGVRPVGTSKGNPFALSALGRVLADSAASWARPGPKETLGSMRHRFGRMSRGLEKRKNPRGCGSGFPPPNHMVCLARSIPAMTARFDARF